MKFRTSLRILIKASFLPVLVLAPILFLISIPLLSGEEVNLDMDLIISDILKVIAMALLVIVMPSLTVGLLFHRIFLRFKLYNVFYTVILAVLCSIALGNIAHGKGESPMFMATVFAFFITPQCFLIRHLTLKELRKA